MQSNSQPRLNHQNNYKHQNATTNHQLSYLEILYHPSALELQNIDYVQPYHTVQQEFGAEEQFWNYWKNVLPEVLKIPDPNFGHQIGQPHQNRENASCSQIHYYVLSERETVICYLFTQTLIFAELKADFSYKRQDLESIDERYDISGHFLQYLHHELSVFFQLWVTRGAVNYNSPFGPFETQLFQLISDLFLSREAFCNSSMKHYLFGLDVLPTVRAPERRAKFSNACKTEGMGEGANYEGNVFVEGELCCADTAYLLELFILLQLLIHQYQLDLFTIQANIGIFQQHLILNYFHHFLQIFIKDHMSNNTWQLLKPIELEANIKYKSKNEQNKNYFRNQRSMSTNQAFQLDRRSVSKFINYDSQLLVLALIYMLVSLSVERVSYSTFSKRLFNFFNRHAEGKEYNPRLAQKSESSYKFTQFHVSYQYYNVIVVIVVIVY